jgi:hypothetical protein
MIPKGEVNVKGLSQHLVKNEEETLKYLFEGKQGKTLAKTK